MSGRHFVLVLVLLTAVISGGTPVKSQQYAAFKQPLPKDQRVTHALNRLTFGPRPGQAEQVAAQGLRKWIDLQLHPERIPENPELTFRLAPLESLQLNARETYLHYPPPRLIRAIARGEKKDPVDDPELRAIVDRLAQKYKERNATAEEDADDRPVPADILTPDQLQTLRKGKPDQKAAILRSIPPGKRLDFILALNPGLRRQLFVLAPVDLRRELMLSVQPQQVVADDLAEGRLFRGVYSQRQLQELLVDFWYNHFNVFLDKGADRYLVPTYEREAIRPHVLGKFYDLLLATAQSPAMLFYLDNFQSSVPNSRSKRGLNENYGRELLELHTLGVDAGYTQKDVTEVARCFTGWTISGPKKGGVFEFNEHMHDEGVKVVLGHTIHAGGMQDGLAVLKLLAESPATAHHISFQLAQRFVADNPPPALVDRMTKTYLKKHGDLREVMLSMIDSAEFWSQGAYEAKVKTPFELVVSALRASNANVESAFVLKNELQKMGEPLYRKLEPTGYSFANTEWVSSAALLERVNFASTLAKNRIPGVTLEGGVNAETLASPEFQKH